MSHVSVFVIVRDKNVTVQKDTVELFAFVVDLMEVTVVETFWEAVKGPMMGVRRQKSRVQNQPGFGFSAKWEPRGKIILLERERLTLTVSFGFCFLLLLASTWARPNPTVSN
jgi:hypothetical protein